MDAIEMFKRFLTEIEKPEIWDDGLRQMIGACTCGLRMTAESIICVQRLNMLIAAHDNHCKGECKEFAKAAKEFAESTGEMEPSNLGIGGYKLKLDRLVPKSLSERVKALWGVSDAPVKETAETCPHGQEGFCFKCDWERK